MSCSNASKPPAMNQTRGGGLVIPKRLLARVMKYTHGSYPTNDISLDANDLLITDANANRFR